MVPFILNLTPIHPQSIDSNPENALKNYVNVISNTVWSQSIDQVEINEQSIIQICKK